MNLNVDLIQQRLKTVRGELHEEALRAGRDPASVFLLAISKGHSVAAITAAAAIGQREFGESYLQEALRKIDELSDLKLIWHYIGQLQSNKTRQVAEHFHWVHTIDREKVAMRLSEQRPHYAPPLNVCIQVKLAEEAAKGGVWPDAVPQLAQRIVQLPHLKLRGLMCIPPPQQQFEGQLEQFRQLAALLGKLNDDVLTADQQLDTLSMGMSDDHAAAIAAGATIVRLGTAIFGERPK